VGYPEADRDALIADLREQISVLQAQLTWYAHSGAASHTGGTFTLALSDLHLLDRGHLVDAYASLQHKTAELIRRFKPRQFFCIINGDSIPGRGVYKQQELENVLTKTDLQLTAGCYRIWEMDSEFAEALGTKTPRKYFKIRGQHDQSMGDDTAMPMVWCLDKLGVPAAFAGIERVHNAADKGYYNILFEHGYGYSKDNPTPPALAQNMREKILRYSNRGFCAEQRIRRVCHAHTHWFNLGMVRNDDIPYDVTGGLQRNDRTNLGRNDRPCGWIAYISPPGTNDVAPIPIQPSTEALEMDRNDPALVLKNMEEAVRCCRGWLKMAEELGILSEQTRSLMQEHLKTEQL
jgi:hypothetical protein